MNVFGAGYNLALFEKHVLAIMEEARLDHAKALPFLDVFLGEVFRKDSLQAKPEEIFIPDIDEYRRNNEVNAGKMLAQVFFSRLGEVVRTHYLPEASPLWRELEKHLGMRLDYNLYDLLGDDQPYCPASEIAQDLFRAALLGQTKLEIIRVQDTEDSGSSAPQEGLLKVKTIEKGNIKLNYHSWRCWFYRLWEQNYEWGSFTLNKRLAEANGSFYQFTLPPYGLGENVVILPSYLLEAHGFKVVCHPDKTIEYWR